MDFKVQSKLMPDVQHRNSLFEVIILLAITILFLIFVVRPKYSMSKVKAAELKTAQSQYQTVESDRKTMNDLIDKLDDSKNDLALVDQALPLQGRVTSLDLLIDNLVSTSGMKLASVNTDEGTNGVAAGDKKLLTDPYGSNRKLQTMLANVTVTGPVEQFRQLLKLIETNSRLMDIDTISISKQDEIIYKIRLKAYFYAPEYDKVNSQ
jgi:Tfp pilus assembly protein PilO